MRTRIVLVSITVVAVLVVVGVLVARQFTGGLPNPLRSDYCTVQGESDVTLNLEQMANAATIAAVGIRRNVPDAAISIALATALQESKLENLDGGDRDSIGLFQQRPSQGWGSPKQIADPRYSAGKFYSALLRVKNWQKMTITQAAQSVQRSGHPDAYQKWAAEAGVLSRALLGDVSHAVSCQVATVPVTRGQQALAALGRDVTGDWGSRAHEIAAPHADSLALVATDAQDGWQYAHWLVAHAEDRGIMLVRFGNQQWTAKAGTWSAATVSANPTQTVIAQVFGS